VPSFRQKSASSGYVRWQLGQVRTVTHRAVEGPLSRAYTTTLDVNEQRSWAVVSFGMGSLSKRQSFPRKRESSPSTAHFRRFVEWIPAFAGIGPPNDNTTQCCDRKSSIPLANALLKTLLAPSRRICEHLQFSTKSWC
jgi:hypothetical protein